MCAADGIVIGVVLLIVPIQEAVVIIACEMVAVIEVEVGAKVLYQKFAGTKVEDNQKQKFLLIEQTDIMAVV